MEKMRVTLREANQYLSRYVAEAERGVEVVITRRGIPVARMTGISKQRSLSKPQRAALDRIFASARPLGIEQDKREALYDRSPG